MNVSLKGALAALAIVVAAGPAGAKGPNFFSLCDGYGVPTDAGDGMTKEAKGFFGLFRPLGSAGNTRRTTPSLGRTGVMACDAALADARLDAKHWMRKVSLIRARALHSLAAGDDAQALIDLDRAEAAAQERDDPFYRRSLGLGIRVIRAYALRRTGRTEEARELAAAILAERPYNRQIALAVLAVAGDESAEIGGEPVVRAIARLEPRAIDTIFLDAFGKGDFAQVIALYPQLSAPVPTADIGVARYLARAQDAKARAMELFYGAERRARYAYALAAAGKSEQAVREIEAARAYLAANTPAVPPAPPADVKEKGSARDKRMAETMVAGAGKVAALAVDEWRKFIDWRSAVQGGATPPTLNQIAASPLPATGAHLDLLRLLKAKGAGGAELDAAIGVIERKLQAAETPRDAEARLLFASLPHAEIERKVNAFRKANSAFVGYLWGGVSGFKTRGGEDGGDVTVEYVGEKSSATVVEEMALLRAADMARERGRSGLVIKERSDYERTTNTIYMGSVIRSDPNGHSTRLVVEFVDRANPPEVYRSTPWRVLDAGKIIESLSPTYVEPEAPAGVAASNVGN